MFIGRHSTRPAFTGSSTVSAFFCLLLATVSSASFAQIKPLLVTATGEEMLFTDDPKDWSRPRIVLPPSYPLNELRANMAASVDIEVQIDELGKVIGTRVLKSVPENKAFEAAVSEVITHWRFYTKMNAECMPIPHTTNQRIWFEVRDGKGVISVSGSSSSSTTATNSSPTTARQIVMLNRSEVLRSVRYPMQARRDEVQADLFAVMSIDAATGEVKSVDITWLTLDGKASIGTKQHFRDAVTEALMNGKFAHFEGGPYKVCAPMSFRYDN